MDGEGVARPFTPLPPSRSHHAATPACTPSRYQFPCAVCSADIVPGDLMFPFVARGGAPTTNPRIGSGESSSNDAPAAAATTAKGGSSSPRRGKGGATSPVCFWAHRPCAALFGPPGVPPPPTCRHWSRLGRCPVRDAGCCAFRHDEADRGDGCDGGDPSSGRGGGRREEGGKKGKRRWRGKRRVLRNGHKNSALRIFLIKTYGVEYLRGGVVLEVAGGKGELAWELVNLVGVECVNVDPRPMSLKNAETRWRKGMYEPRRTGPVFQKWLPAVDEGSSKNRTTRRPAHLRCFFDAESFCRLARHESFGAGIFDAQRWLQEGREKAMTISWTTRGLQHEDEHKPKDHECQEDSSELNCANDCDENAGNEVTEASVARSLVKRTSLVLGLHPDQAAGDIVDFADRVGVPWCIVPCCVYSDLFTKRRLGDGTRVTTHSHLMQWLKEKNPDCRIEKLGIDGKNEVIYTLPQQCIA